MRSQNRILGILLGVLALLVLVVGGLSAVLLGQGDGEATGSDTPSMSMDEAGGSSDAHASGRLRLSGNDPITLDPALVTDAGSAQYISEIYSGLTTISPDLRVELDLAEDLWNCRVDPTQAEVAIHELSASESWNGAASAALRCWFTDLPDAPSSLAS